MKEIELVHPGGEVKTLPIETIDQKKVSIRWGMSGVYDIDLVNNTVTARSVAARRKGMCYWKVRDIDALRKLVSDYFNLHRQTELGFNMDKHAMTMPGVKR